MSNKYFELIYKTSYASSYFRADARITTATMVYEEILNKTYSFYVATYSKPHKT